MSERLVIIGCGGFGREVHDIVDAINETTQSLDLLGYVDDDPSETNLKLIEARGSRLLGPVGWFNDADPSIRYVIGIGTGSIRRAIDTRLGQLGFTPATIVHPAASLGYDVRVGDGSVICAGVRMTTNISTGRHVHINLNSTIGHDSNLADYVTINPLVAVSGWVRIDAGAMLGTHSAVLQELSVGMNSVVGAGACVVRDVPPHALVKGVPAR